MSEEKEISQKGSTQERGIETSKQARELELEQMLELARELARELESELARELALAPELARVLARELAWARARELAPERARKLALEPELARARARALERMLELEQMLAPEQKSASEPELALAPEPELERERARRLARAREQAQERARELKLKAETILIFDTDESLTPQYLTETIAPYLNAVAKIQQVIDEIQDNPHKEAKIHFITQNTPITATVSGVAQAVQIIGEMTIPWKRKHAQKMTALAQAEKQAQIQMLNAEVSESKAWTEKERAKAEAKRIESEQMRLENEKLRRELAREKMQLVLGFVNQIGPELKPEDKMIYVQKFLPHLETILSSPLRLTVEQPSDGKQEAKAEGIM